MTWTCDETRDALRRAGTLPLGAIEHVATCTLCQELADFYPETTSLSGPPARATLDLAQALAVTNEQCRSERGVVAWFRSRSTRWRIALAVACALLPVAAQLLVARRADLMELPRIALLTFVTAYGAAIAFSTSAALSPLQRPSRPWHAAFAIGLAFGLPLVVVGASLQRFGLGAFLHADRAIVEPAFSCLRYGTMLAVPSIALLFVMRRHRSETRRFLLTVAALGSSVGNFVLLLHCGNEQPAHQLLGHASIGVVLIVALAILDALWTRHRDADR